uniref:(northern house mosquito) hypothetical protein n=1 Tax=Culex pipiens TaxID=7175 RepID=A0A8D8APP9_CULPI
MQLSKHTQRHSSKKISNKKNAKTSPQSQSNMHKKSKITARKKKAKFCAFCKSFFFFDKLFVFYTRKKEVKLNQNDNNIGNGKRIRLDFKTIFLKENATFLVTTTFSRINSVYV